jgi:hypothetical protein
MERRLIRTLTPSWCAAQIAEREARAEAAAAETGEDLPRPEPRPRKRVTLEEVHQAAVELAEADPTGVVRNRQVARRLGVPMSTVGFLAAVLRNHGRWPEAGVPVAAAGLKG